MIGNITGAKLRPHCEGPIATMRWSYQHVHNCKSRWEATFDGI